MKVIDQTATNVRNLLSDRYDEIKMHRDAINDHYSHEDLYLQMAYVDCESEIIEKLLGKIDEVVEQTKESTLSAYCNDPINSVQWRAFIAEKDES